MQLIRLTKAAHLSEIHFASAPLRRAFHTAIAWGSKSIAMVMFLCWALGLSLLAPSRAEAAFGLTNSGGYYTVDTGAGLVFKVKQTNGDVTSLNYNGVEYQNQTRFSQVNSGLGSATVTGALWGSQTIKIEVVAGTLTHYYLARKGQNNIYMGTYFTEEPTIGLVRYIVRIPSAKLPNGPATSDIRNNTGAIEASDVFGYANGQTRSKHYSDHRLMDFTYTGATGTNVGVFMVRSNHEGGSGGPFYRTIDNQCGDDQEIYEIVNYGEGQTEPFRLGVFNGPYILTFTNGSTPTTPIDTSWVHSTGIDATLKGWVQDRGTVTGQATGIPDGFQGVVGFANATAQYWCVANGGSFTSPAMIPGTYTMTLYKGELSVASQSVTVTANTTVTQNIASTEVVPYQRWRIGEWDGTPAGFLNADKVTAMHPSDSRMSPWGPATYTVGSSSASSFPAYQWKDINNPTTVKFNLTQAELTNHTLRVGLTCAYSGARPQVTVNSWSSAIPAISTQPDSRTLTVGTYRGNNVTYTYNIPASAFVAGTNTLSIYVVSGSGSTGFLSAGYSYDCVELDAPLNGTFRLTPQHAQDKALSLLNSNPNNGAQTVISSYQPSTSQQFVLDQQGDGSYRIRTALVGNRCVELPFGNASDGNLIKLWDDNGNPAQRWNIVPVSSEWVKIVPQNDASKCMDVTGGPLATANGTTVQSWTYTGLSNQLWKLTPVALASGATPLVQNDTYIVPEDNTLAPLAGTGVLANDSGTGTLSVVDSDAAMAGVQPLSGPTQGTLTLNANGSFSYKPTLNWSGTDSFTYQATDGTRVSDVATVSITVTPVNDTPVATAQSLKTDLGKALAISLTGTDVENDALTYSVVSGPAKGRLGGTVPNLTYTPNAGYAGSDSFSFKVNDGKVDSAPATVTIAVLPGLSVADVSVAEGNSGSANAVFTVTLSAASGQTVSVSYATADGSATAGSDYTATSGTLSFAAGTTSKTITVPVAGDTAVEPNETFTLKLSAPVNATVTRDQATGTITNDDADTTLPSVTVTTPAASPNDVYASLSAATGTASSSSGIASVTGLLYRDVNSATGATAAYWNWTTQSWNATYSPACERLATGTTNWNVAFPALAEGSHWFRATARGKNGQVATSGRVFLIDTTPPSVTVTTPAASPNNVYASLSTATGTASSNIGIASVMGLLFRQANSATGATEAYWNWTTQSWVATYSSACERLATGTTNWSVAFPALAEGSYWFRATVFSKSGKSATSGKVFLIDATPPTVTITTPGASPNNVYASLSTATGTASSNSGIVSVVGLLCRQANSSTGTTAAYWNWTTQSWNATYSSACNRVATGTTSWSVALPPLTAGSYWFQATVQSKSGKTASSGKTFQIKSSSAPSANSG